MNRTFDAQGLVVLPKLDAGGAFSVGEALLTRAKQEELPGPIADEVKKLKVDVAELGEALRARFEMPSEEQKLEAHRSMGARWKAAHDLLTAWVEIEAGKKSELAQRLSNALFAEGLAFARASYRTAWTESEQRLAWLDEHELDGAFVELSGAEFLRELRAAHKKYGEALGIKKATEHREPPSLRDPFDAVLSRIRKYVIQVTAYGEADVEGARQLAERLLAPLAEIQPVRPKVTGHAPEVSDAPEVEAPAAPAPVTAPPSAPDR